jgi:hypothetical protein
VLVVKQALASFDDAITGKLTSTFCHVYSSLSFQPCLVVVAGISFVILAQAFTFYTIACASHVKSTWPRPIANVASTSNQQHGFNASLSRKRPL